MKKFILSAVLSLGVAGSAFAAGGAGDLILGFRDDGSAGGSGTSTNTTIDLGSYLNFESGGQFATGTTVATGINLGTDGLAATYGSSYLTDSGLFFGVVGTTGNTTSTRDLFASAAATGSTLTPGVATSTAWNVRSVTSQSTQAAKFLTLDANNVGGFNGVSTSATTASTSWSTEGNFAVNAFGAFGNSLFEQTAVGNAVDLYELNPQAGGPGNGNPGVFLGTFSIDSSGNLDFTAIPEPSTYAMILGVAVLGVAVLRRRQQSLAL